MAGRGRGAGEAIGGDRSAAQSSAEQACRGDGVCLTVLSHPLLDSSTLRCLHPQSCWAWAGCYHRLREATGEHWVHCCPAALLHPTFADSPPVPKLLHDPLAGHEPSRPCYPLYLQAPSWMKSHFANCDPSHWRPIRGSLQDRRALWPKPLPCPRPPTAETMPTTSPPTPTTTTTPQPRHHRAPHPTLPPNPLPPAPSPSGSSPRAAMVPPIAHPRISKSNHR